MIFGIIKDKSREVRKVAYSELIKNFEKIRAYMREFYVYGFRSRTEFASKSTRSYDDERRRIESWLGDYMRFTQTAEGKNVFLSVDSRITKHNPLYKALKAKSFTDGDITLHFAIFDLLSSPEIEMTLGELIDGIDRLLCSAISFDESTLRKKLKEYTEEGIIQTRKQGRKVLYSRSCDTDISSLSDVIDFSSEILPCGVIGSFLSDKIEKHESLFSFKHHYITHAIDSDITATLFDAISSRRYITIKNAGKNVPEARTIRLVPLKILISVQNGRQNLIAYHEKANRLNSYRLDYISDVKIEEHVCERFDLLRKRLAKAEAHMWGVNCRLNPRHTEHVEFDIRINGDEQFIVNRLEREKRCGRVEKLDDFNYRYVADVFDINEMIPWIRTFICRITRVSFSDRRLEKKFIKDIEKMYAMYDVGGGDENAVQ